VELPVLNTKGEVVGKANLSDYVYAAPPNPDLLHQAMVYHQANQRQGTSSTKTRANVSGGGRKPFSQKHTGRARQGSIRSPLNRHGGITFGPHPRDYRKQLLKKMRRQAIRCALSHKAQEGKLLLVQDLETVGKKTADMAQLLTTLAIKGSALVAMEEPRMEAALAIRNLPRVKALRANLLNVLDLLRYDTLLMTVSAARRAETLWDSAQEDSEAA
jgi:large subunit ribosomal protein L4